MKNNVGEGLSKSSEMVVNMQKWVVHQNSKLIPGATTFRPKKAKVEKLKSRKVEKLKSRKVEKLKS